MAVYLSPNRRRRRFLVVAVLALTLGLVVGVFIGRRTATGLDDEVNSARRRGQEVAAAFRTLPIEYEQLKAGTGGKSQEAFDESVQRIIDRLTMAIRQTPWLGPSARSDLVAAAEAVQRSAAAGASPDSFRATVEAAATAAEDVFNAPRTSGGAA